MAENPPKADAAGGPAPSPPKKSVPWWAWVAGTMAFFAFGAVFFTFFILWKAFAPMAPTLSAAFDSNRVVVMRLEGPIFESHDFVKRLRGFRKGPAKALVLFINSPGGGVAASQEIFQEVLRVREDGKVVVASISGTGASGAYYVASAADRIFANPGSITGSIGVVLELPDASQIFKKIGLRFQTIQSGKYKTTGSLDKPLTPEETRYLQKLIDDVYRQFLEDVVDQRADVIRNVLAERRKKKPEEVKDDEVWRYLEAYADGRIWTGRQAYDLGFVDAIGNFWDAVQAAAELAGLKGEPEVWEDRPLALREWFFSWLPWKPERAMSSTLRLEYRLF